MITLKKCDSSHLDFVALVKDLDAFLAITDGDEHDFYDQFNGIEQLEHVLLGYEDEIAVACGAFKPYDATSVEIKRMFTTADARGKGYAVQLLDALEEWAKAIGNTTTVLETGTRQTAAIALYEKCGYARTAKYPPYDVMENSVCFKKEL